MLINRAEGERLSALFFSVCQESAIMRYLMDDGQKYGLKIPAETTAVVTWINFEIARLKKMEILIDDAQLVKEEELA